MQLESKSLQESSELHKICIDALSMTNLPESKELVQKAVEYLFAFNRLILERDGDFKAYCDQTNIVINQAEILGVETQQIQLNFISELSESNKDPNFVLRAHQAQNLMYYYIFRKRFESANVFNEAYNFIMAKRIEAEPDAFERIKLQASMSFIHAKIANSTYEREACIQSIRALLSPLLESNVGKIKMYAVD